MKIIELSIHGDVYFFLDTLTEQQFNIISVYIKNRFGKHSENNCVCQIEEFIAEMKQHFAITLERVCISKVIAI